MVGVVDGKRCVPVGVEGRWRARIPLIIVEGVRARRWAMNWVQRAEGTCGSGHTVPDAASGEVVGGWRTGMRAVMMRTRMRGLWVDYR